MFTLRRVLIALGVVVAGALIVVAAGQDADDGVEEAEVAGDAVEELRPGRGDLVLRQSEIGIDLAPSWTGVLVIDGTEIPEDELRRNDPLNQVFFAPREGRVIDALDPGRHVAAALIWRPGVEERENARTVTWAFDVN